MKLRSIFAVLAMLVVATLAFAPGAQAAKPAKLLKNVPVTGSLASGGTFKGKVTITSFSYDEGLRVSGIVKGSATDAAGVSTDVEQTFSNVRTTLVSQSGPLTPSAQAGSCQILFLDIGPIFLDLLGLQLDLSQITLDLTAVSGAGNLLGNLLCAVAGLLDPAGFLNTLLGTLTQLNELLRQINQLL